MSTAADLPPGGRGVAEARASLVGPGSAFEIAIEDVRGVRLPVFRNRLRSLREILEASARFPERLYVVEEGVRIDYSAHLRQVDALAAALQREYRVEAGQRVALFAANRWEWIVAFWAIASTGAIPCAYNGWWTADEFEHASGLVEPSLILGDEPRLERAAAASRRIPTLDLARVRPLSEAYAGAKPAAVGISEDDPALLLFTSGTTGRPKAVSTSHRGLCGFLQVNHFAEALGRILMGGEVPAPGDALPTGDDVVLVTSPLFHTSMLYGVVLRQLTRGGTAVLLPGKFDPERVLTTIGRERVTSWLALGSAAPRVCSLPGRERYDTSSLTHIGVGGAPVSPAVQQSIRETFPCAAQALSMGYASTESVSVVASIAGREFAAHPTSTGRLAATVELELRDSSGNAVPEGELGEVHVRSPYVMLGYWNDPAASAAVLKPDGWLAMGDLARMVGGLLYIDSRARDLILVSAENVSPTEVEHRLEEHPQVREAAVFAVDDPLTGDAVCAVVVTDPASTIGSEALVAWCRSHLAHYKVPTRWHVVHEHLPRTASGKLVKHEIRRLVESGIEPAQGRPDSRRWEAERERES